MPISKLKIIDAIKAMPQEEFEDIDEVIEEIILLEKIEQGLKDMQEGRVYTEEEAKKIMYSWLK
ncbi:MAG: hypothetical protein PW786_09310 [Arachidicoccus sp.]|nr:hypothetical protein [Arachidicoccus sp.]